MLDWISWSEQPHTCRCTNWVICWDCYRYSHAGAASGAQQASMATANTLQCQPIAQASCWGYGKQESLQTFYWICSGCNQIHHGDSMTWSMISMFCCKACAHHGPWQCRGEGAAAWCLFSVTWACCSFLWFECYVSQHPLQQVLWGPSSWACGVFPFLVKHIEVFDGCTVLGKHLYLWSPLLKGAITQ
jgi:hypothetical protein